MRITTLVLTFILASSGLTGAQEYAEYVNVQDGFKIDFPGQPAVRDITWTTQQDYKVPARVYTVDKGDEFATSFAPGESREAPMIAGRSEPSLRFKMLV